MRVVFLGPPGAGKGTQARFLQERFRIPRISTGDLLRKAVSDRDPLGEKATEYIDRGMLVPDGLMLELIAERLFGKGRTSGFVLDGFPRTTPQALGLETLLRDHGSRLDRVLFIRIPRELVVQRLAGRRTCRSCGIPYHLVFDPPSSEGVCDRCHGELYQREDDREEMIAARLDVYETQTAPLIDYYRERDLLQEIDGVGNVEEIKARVLQSLGIVGT